MTEKETAATSSPQDAFDTATNAAIDGIFRSYSDSEDPQIRAQVEESNILGLRPFLAPVIEHYIRSLLRQFHAAGFDQGFDQGWRRGAAVGVALDLKQGESCFGDKTVVTKLDSAGRIAETVKVPLTLAERVALDASKS